MTEVVGKNTLAGAELQAYVDRLERIDEQKKQLSEDRKAIVQEAKSRGFSTAGISYLIKVRKMKPHDRQEAESIRDLYLHALGMDNDPPLFRQIEALAKDVAGGARLLEAFQLLAPPTGHIIISIQGKQVRIFRDKDGNARSEDYTPPESGVAPGRQRPAAAPAAPPPEVAGASPDMAEELGRVAFRNNISIISNPFPHDDSRRPRWDRGWRLESGSDGMGQDD